MYSFIQIVMGEYKTWTIYIVMEYIGFSIQKGKVWVYKKLSTIFRKLDHVTQNIISF